MKKSRKRYLPLLVLIIILLSFALSSQANEGGFGDSHFDGNECLSCHEQGENLGLGAGYASVSIGTRLPIIKIRVRVNMVNIPSPSDKYGVMLLTPDYGNLSEDGWLVLSDPNNNPVPKNYIERPRLNNDILEWRVENEEGHYIVKVLVFYGSYSKEYLDERDIEIIVSTANINSPPELESPKAILLSDDKTWNFEVTYKDAEGIAPNNITVNISGLGSFEMLPRSTSILDFQEGVIFYHLTTLPEDRYSYHFAAFDGDVWNTTENAIFFTTSPAEFEADFVPLIFGFLIAFVVVSAVYILRKK